MRDQTVYHLSQLSPGMRRRSMFLAYELAAGLAAFQIARSAVEQSHAVVLALLFTFGFAICYGAMALVRHGADDPTVTFSIVTRISLVPAFEVPLAVASGSLPLLYALMHVGFVFWIGIAMVEGMVKREESWMAAEASRTLLTIQLVVFAVVLSVDNAYTTWAVAAGAALVVVALRLRSSADAPSGQAESVTKARLESAEERGVQ
ncbi:hypothetical protein HY633_05600 [Candidatus Uhrbacteria bacterium]|nr:hypothetical protein [Candidatus Uhrbacteria bacterium]